MKLTGRFYVYVGCNQNYLTKDMNLKSLFLVLVLIVSNISLIAQVDNFTFDDLLCRQWTIKCYEDDGEVFPPKPEHQNDLMIFYRDGGVKSIENMIIKNGEWKYDPSRKILSIVDLETKEKVIMKVLKINFNEFVIEYKGPESSGLVMHMVPKL